MTKQTNAPLKFQEATANHVLDLFKSGQKRVLIGDEAGLGKTRVAATVVERVKNDLKHEVVDDDGLYCIVYVCCNMQIAQQNIGILCNSASKVDISQSRLSMQHFVYHKLNSELKHGDTMIMSLTPATSFKMTGGMGSAPERALIYNCLIEHDAFKGDQNRCNDLSDILQGNAIGNWKSYKDTSRKEIRKLDKGNGTNDFIEDIKNAMAAHNDELVKACDDAISKFKAGESHRDDINKLRRIFADISLETMKPDLVIMDEFQKFSSLLDNSSDTEENRIARKFFSRSEDQSDNSKDPYILLLSATPYKPYTTLEEINISKNDEQFQDFHRLMDFLYATDATKAEAFRSTWKEYSTLLNQLDKVQPEIVLQKHKEAENMLYGVMGRTERSNKDIILEILPDLSGYINKGDIESYMQMRRLVDSCKQHGATTLSAPVDYTKSCAYQLSFMENYKLKDKIEEAWNNGVAKGLKIDRLLLDKESIDNYTLRDYGNARLSYVIDSVFGKGKDSTGVENLLWVPASKPYYRQEKNVFTRNADFSKTLVFSSWGMVPRMLSCLISYECERRARVNRNYSDPIKDGTKSMGKTVLHTVSTWLADQYDPQKHYQKDICTIKNEIAAAIKNRIDKIAPNPDRAARISSLDIYQLLLALDKPELGVRKIHDNAAEILADMAIGAPAMCLYRVFKEMGSDNEQTPETKALAKSSAEELAEKMLKIFNTPHGAAAVNNTCQQGIYFQKVVDYCIKGNLQAVLDEFVHMIGENEIKSVAERIDGSLIDAGNLKVNTLQTFETESADKTKAFLMPKHFAVDLAGENSNDEKDAKHAINVRMAFNSPFRPFILSSTSVGQEGLDFHWYSRKMIHWNLPGNPQDLEQREGRINRYKCLSVRRNIAKLYEDVFGWKDMFERGRTELSVNDSGMIPFWYLPLDHGRFAEMKKAGRIERIERIVPMYPLSEDVERYENLINVLTLYRLTMGQPRQEDLVKMLSKTSSPEIIDKLIFQLSPYFKNIQTNDVASLHNQ